MQKRIPLRLQREGGNDRAGAASAFVQDFKVDASGNGGTPRTSRVPRRSPRYQAGIYCASGACCHFIDEGVIGCGHLSRADCDNLYVDGELQITDFHSDELCVTASE